MRRLLLLLLTWATLGLWAEEPIRIVVNNRVSMNPLLIYTEDQNQLIDLLFDRLVTLDVQGRFVPQILESWAFSPDQRVVTLKVRPGLRWHNEQVLDADDILFTWRMLRSPKLLDLADNQAADIPHMEKVDALTLRIRLDRPRATLLAELYNFFPVPRTYPAVTDPNAHPYNRKPIGSGPFRLAPDSTPDHVRLVRWPGYRGPNPAAWPELDFIFPKDGGSTRTIEDGSMHFMESGSWFTHYLVRSGARKYKNVQHAEGTREGFRALWFNCDATKSTLGDARIRRALAELYPWDAISRVRSVRPIQAAGCVWPPSSFAHDGTPRSLPRRQVAETDLDEAGWRRGPDGWRRNAQGRELRLEFVHEPVSLDPLIASFIESAREIGIRIEDRIMPFDKTLESQQKGTGDLWLVSWVNNGPDPSGDRKLFTSEGLPSKTNFARYVNPEVDQLFEDGLHAGNLEQRTVIYRRINQILLADRPLLLLDYQQYFTFYNRRLKGVVYNKRGTAYGFVPGMRGWTLEE